jgi:hypothetical protein
MGLKKMPEEWLHEGENRHADAPREPIRYLA